MRGSRLPDRACLNCGVVFHPRHDVQRFCGLSCSSKHRERTPRPIKESSRAMRSLSMAQWWATSPAAPTLKDALRARGLISQVGKRAVTPDSLLELSSRTVSKVLRRLGLPCSNCGWDRTICDLHHIHGRKIPNPHAHHNLAYLCPNCHRLAHEGKLQAHDIIPFSQQIGDSWRVLFMG